MHLDNVNWTWPSFILLLKQYEPTRWRVKCVNSYEIRLDEPYHLVRGTPLSSCKLSSSSVVAEWRRQKEKVWKTHSLILMSCHLFFSKSVSRTRKLNLNVSAFLFFFLTFIIYYPNITFGSQYAKNSETLLLILGHMPQCFSVIHLHPVHSRASRDSNFLQQQAVQVFHFDLLALCLLGKCWRTPSEHLKERLKNTDKKTQNTKNSTK